MQIKISIIIVTYNSQKYMDSCLNSIGQFLDILPSQVEVIIVDNSLDKNAEELKYISEHHPLNQVLKLKYIHNSANLGYGQGNNVGIKGSSGEVLCIMNPDVRFLEPLLKDVIEEFKNSNLAMLGYKQKSGYDYSFYMKPEFKTPISGWELKIRNKLEQFNEKKHYLSGAFLFINKTKFEEVGLFDENIFMYYEEPDISRRLQLKGGKIIYKNNKEYQHLVGNRVEFSEKAFISEIESLKYYLCKFKLNEKNIIKKYLLEYRIKLSFARILNDKVRITKFNNEVELIKEIFEV